MNDESVEVERDRLRAALARIEAGDFALRDEEHDERAEVMDIAHDALHPEAA